MTTCDLRVVVAWALPRELPLAVADAQAGVR